MAWDRCGQCGPVGQWGWGGAGDSAGGGQGHGMPPRQLHLPPAARTPARAAPRLPACTVQAAGVPKLFRHSGRVRNKHLSKRDTEKLVKEIWRERMADPGREVAGGLDGGGESHAECCSCCGACGPCCPLTAAPLLPRCLSPAAALAGTAVDLLEFVFQQLQKKVGIMTAVVEVRGTGQWGVARRWARRAVVAGRRRARSAVVAQAARPTPAAPPPPPQAGYNFLYGLWRYQWDADCELFLRILLVCGGGGGAAAALGGAGPPPGWPAWHPRPSPPLCPIAHRPCPSPPTWPPQPQGEVKEDVYVAQVRLQEELEELFAAMDRAKGQASGYLDKARAGVGLPAARRQGKAWWGDRCIHYACMGRGADSRRGGGQLQMFRHMLPHFSPLLLHRLPCPVSTCVCGAGGPAHRPAGLLQGGAARGQDAQAL